MDQNWACCPDEMLDLCLIGRWKATIFLPDHQQMLNKKEGNKKKKAGVQYESRVRQSEKATQYWHKVMDRIVGIAVTALAPRKVIFNAITKDGT